MSEVHLCVSPLWRPPSHNWGFSKPRTRDRGTSGLFCGSFLRKDEVFAYFGLFQKLKDLKDQRTVCTGGLDP